MDRLIAAIALMLIGVLGIALMLGLQVPPLTGAEIAGRAIAQPQQAVAQKHAFSLEDAPDLKSEFSAAARTSDGKSATPIENSVRFKAGDTLVLVEKTTNAGVGHAASSTTRISTDERTFDFYKPPLPAGNSANSRVQIECSSPGTFYVYSAADYGNAIRESDEENNAAFLSIECE